MRKVVFFFFLIYFVSGINAQIRVACLGNSITYGAGLDRNESYPAQLQKLLGKGWNVQNFGVSGRTLLQKGDFPYVKERAYEAAKSFAPDIVVLMLGTNDAKPQNWKYRDNFIADYTRMIQELKSLSSQPLILICLPVPVYGTNFMIRDTIVNHNVQVLVKNVAKENNVTLVDLHKPLSNHPEWFPDKIHPDKQGARVIANVLAQKLLQMRVKILNRKR